jgi:hypothetical protein
MKVSRESRVNMERKVSRELGEYDEQEVRMSRESKASRVCRR